MAYWHPHRLHWWVADEEGRTRPVSDMRVRALYKYRAYVEPPPKEKGPASATSPKYRGRSP